MSRPDPVLPPTADGIANFPALYAKTRRFSVGVPRNLSVLPDGSVLFLRSRNGLDPTLCLWRVSSTVEELLIDPSRLNTLVGAQQPDGALPDAELARRERARESADGIVSYAVDRGGNRLCFALGGSLFVYDLGSGTVTNPSNSDQVFDPRLSPNGSHVAYVAGSDLRVVELDDEGNRRSEHTLADEPAAEQSRQAEPAQVNWGRAEFVAAEEMQRSRGFWWGPSGQNLLVTRTDDSRVRQWWIADPALPGRAPRPIRYPVTGTANTDVELWLVELDGTRREVRWNNANVYEYLANVIWPINQEPVLVQQTRDQRRVSMSTLDLETLETTERRTASDDTWVELIASSPTVFADGLLTVEDLYSDSDSRGHRALLANGKPLTGPELHVASIVGQITTDFKTTVVVTAWTEPSEIHLFAVSFTSTGSDPVSVVALSKDPGVYRAVMGQIRTEEASVEQSEVVVVLTKATPERQAVEVSVYRCTAEDLSQGSLGSAVTTIADLSERSPVPALPTFVDLGADRLSSALFLPSNFDGESQLPVLLDPYGGPHAQRVLKNHTPHLVSQWFAEQGFAVLVTDGRGTPGRGPWWERQLWGDLAAPVLEDQIEALETAAEEFDVLDLNRVGIRGWSFGGYLAALAVLRRPDRFHAAIAGAPVTTWNLYDTHYTERYLGRPDLFPQHYRAGDLLNDAPKLQRPLLLIHGLADDNVVAAHTLRLSSALLNAGRPHQVLPLSGVTHMTPQESVAQNLLWNQLAFLKSSLGLDSVSS